MTDVSIFRLYVLRAMYALILVGLAVQIWPSLLQPPAGVEHMKSVVRCMLVALSVLAALGLRYPLKMLPLLFFELAWKVLWVVVYGVPLWLAGQLTPGTSETLFACLMGVVLVPLALPWRYIWTNYVPATGDRWTRDDASQVR
jgi:hypothetical protein